jgi:hypothetical protein
MTKDNANEASPCPAVQVVERTLGHVYHQHLIFLQEHGEGYMRSLGFKVLNLRKVLHVLAVVWVSLCPLSAFFLLSGWSHDRVGPRKAIRLKSTVYNISIVIFIIDHIINV